MSQRDVYAETMDQIVSAFRTFAMMGPGVINGDDLARVRRTLELADTIGPIQDPTAYRNALWSGDLERQQKLLRLYDRTVAGLKEIWDDVPGGESEGENDG